MSSTRVLNEEDRNLLREENNVKYGVLHSTKDKVIPATFSFENLSYSIINRKKNKQLLNGVSGVVKPGSVLAIMGPSGAGKTTLLDILAGRATKGVITQGSIKLNGSEIRSSDSIKYLKRISGYVMQDDSLIAALTVKETLNYVAMLKLQKLSQREREDRVDQILQQLNLWDVRDRLIGSQFQRGISGGERRRVSIGIELITAPSILFLDEPTSGLDGTSAYLVMKTIIDLAETGCAIICTIHQPRANIFSLFDKLLLLTSGRVCYYGLAKQAIDYFQSLGCPYDPYDSASDWMLDLVTNRKDEESEIPLDNQTNKIDFAAEFERSSLFQKCKEELREISSNAALQHVEKYASPIWWQIYVITLRNVKHNFRNPAIIWIRLFQAIFMAVLVGSIFWQVSDYTSGIKTRTSAMFFVITFQVLSSFASLPYLIEERGRFNREIQSNIYSTFSYFFAEFLSITPLLLLFSVAFGLTAYIMVGFQMVASKIAFFLFATCLLAEVGDALCKSIGALVPTFSIANAIASILITFFMLFCGFFLPATSLPTIWQWAPYTSLFKYSFDALLVNEFTGLEFTCEPGTLPLQCTPNTLIPGEAVLNYLDIQSEKMWGDIFILFIIFVIFKILQFLFLRFLNKEKR